MNGVSRFSVRTSFYTFCVLIAGASGCATLSPSSSSLLEFTEPRDNQTAHPAEDYNAPKFTVEIRPHEKESKSTQLPFQEGLVLQDMLVRSGAGKKFDRMNISIARSNQDGGGVHMLRSSYDHLKQRIPEAANYAIWPGDRVIFEEIPYSQIDVILDRALGPVGRMLGI
jgi:hypothetical protein